MPSQCLSLRFAWSLCGWVASRFRFSADGKQSATDCEATIQLSTLCEHTHTIFASFFGGVCVSLTVASSALSLPSKLTCSLVDRCTALSRYACSDQFSRLRTSRETIFSLQHLYFVSGFSDDSIRDGDSTDLLIGSGLGSSRLCAGPPRPSARNSLALGLTLSHCNILCF
jgi:hypothetical protein